MDKAGDKGGDKAVDKAKLLKPRDAWPEAEVELEVGTVRVRALTRGESLELRALGAEDPVRFDRKMVAFCMVDPKLTEAEVGEWQNNSLPAEIERITDVIAELSGLREDAGKAAYKSAGE